MAVAVQADGALELSDATDEHDWSESRHQMELFRWADGQIKGGRRMLKFLAAIPNGRGFVTKKCLNGYNGYGFRSGMPDVIYPVPRGGYHGMFLELKSLGKRAKVSDDQWEMLTKLARLGHYTCVCHGHREAIDAINRYEGII